MAPKRPAATTTTKRPSHPTSTVSPNGSPNQAPISRTPYKSPTESPMKRAGNMAITQAQKQALIDNLQLEVTERARKLRAQYALQAQGLRTRLEIRVHRIPAALRKVTVGKLMVRYAAGEGDQAAKNRVQASPIKSPAKTISPGKGGLLQLQSPTKMGEKLRREVQQQQQGKRGVKRKSDVLEQPTNQDTAITQQTNPAQAQPPKRAKPSTMITSTTTANPTTSTTNAPPSTHPTTAPTREVLSPKSSNTRTLPSHTYTPLKSPEKSPEKSPSKFGFIYTSPTKRPISPVKPSITAPTATSAAKMRTVSAKATGSRAVSKSKAGGAGAGGRTKAITQPKRMVEESTDGDSERPKGEAQTEGGERGSNISTADSSTSAGTTIVKKSTAVAGTKAGAVPTGTVRGLSKTTGAAGGAKANTATARTASKTTGATAAAEGRGTGTIPRGMTAAAKKALSARSEAVGAAGAASGVMVKGGRTLRKRGV